MTCKKLFHGIRSLNWDFWKRFPEEPRECAGFLYCMILLTLRDMLRPLYVPKEERDALER